MAADQRQPVIGIAGGVGAGKSAVAAALADLGCLVVNSDDLARQALEDPEIRRTLRDWWGEAIFDEHGRIHRRAVADIVFTDPLERARLESLTHPWIERKRKARFAAAGPEVPALVIDAPLLFEAGLDRICDAVLFVDTPRSTRLERLAASRGWDEAELDRRESSQLPLDEKRRRSDHTIVNTGSRDALVEQVRRVLNLIADART